MGSHRNGENLKFGGDSNEGEEETTKPSTYSYFVSGVARAYGAIHNWIGRRIGRNISYPPGEYELAKEVVDTLEIPNRELGKWEKLLVAHSMYYLQVLALPPPGYEYFDDDYHNIPVDLMTSNDLDSDPVGSEEE